VARSTGIILVVGGITFANEAVFAPIASGGNISSDWNWRIIPATLVAAALLAGLEQISPRFAVGLSYIALITVLFTRLGKAPAPVESLAQALGYANKALK
jgi:hypothetical protein